MSFHQPTRPQQGLTLVEMMIAITISTILMSGMLQVLVSNNQHYRTQEATSRLQESGRFAAHLITQEIRMADFWGCAGSTTNITDHLNHPPVGTSNPATPQEGGIAGTNDNGLNGSDTITLQGALGSGIRVNTHDVVAATFSVSSINHSLDNGDVVLVSDCQNADLFQVSDAHSGTHANVTAATGSGIPGNASHPETPYADGVATMFKVRKITYSIKTSTSGQPALYRKHNGSNVEMVEGVENMQILYGEDTDNDKTANRYVEADTAGLVMDNVVSVHLTLTLRTIEDNVAGAATHGDRRIRRTYTTTITIRNRV